VMSEALKGTRVVAAVLRVFGRHHGGFNVSMVSSIGQFADWWEALVPSKAVLWFIVIQYASVHL